ncbi:hypothetical protein ACUXST_000402 [Sphingomonas sp. F9_3S_D5_B_2]
MIRLGLAFIAGATALFGPTELPRPAALSQASAGVWELRRLPDGKPLRQCIADITTLAQVEHRHQSCSRKVVSSDGTTTVLGYTCGGGGFGQSKLTLVTPRSLNIETQGISGGLPFSYVVHARRVGPCAAP